MPQIVVVSTTLSAATSAGAAGNEPRRYPLLHCREVCAFARTVGSRRLPLIASRASCSSAAIRLAKYASDNRYGVQ